MYKKNCDENNIPVAMIVNNQSFWFSLSNKTNIYLISSVNIDWLDIYHNLNK